MDSIGSVTSGAPQVVQWPRIHLQMQGTQEVGLIPGLGRSLAEGNGVPAQCSCLGSTMNSELCEILYNFF